MVGSAWQRCRVHFMRNVLARVKRNNTHMVIAAIQTIFAQPDATSVGEQFDRIVATLEGQFPDVATMLTDAKEDLLAFCGLPRGPLAEGLVLQPAGAPPPGDQAPHRRGRGVPRTTEPSNAWSPPWWSRPTTSGRWPSAATCRRPRWPSSAGTRRQPSPRLGGPRKQAPGRLRSLAFRGGHRPPRARRREGQTVVPRPGAGQVR